MSDPESTVISMPLVAIVTDQAAFAESVGGVLERGVWSTVVIPSAVFSQLLPDHTPDLVILHWSGAQPRGLELLRRLRQVSDVPVIALTNNYKPTAVARILTAGADDVIEVGIDRALILARVRAVLRRCAPPTTSANVKVTSAHRTE